MLYNPRHMCYNSKCVSGCSSVWLECLLGVQEVACSSQVTPTSKDIAFRQERKVMSLFMPKNMVLLIQRYYIKKMNWN